MKKLAVIMAGGSGTRFWPKSSQKNPKQFLKLVTKKTMIQETRDRVAPLVGRGNVSVVSPKEFGGKIKSQLGAKVKMTFEPEPKNTMAAVCLAAWSCEDDSAVLAILPADAHIADVKGYQKALKDCFEIAGSEEVIVCLGIKPTFPATGYGYIKVGAHLSESAYRVDQFVEKPQFEKAQDFFRSGKYLWNAGIFVFKVATFKAEVQKHAPDFFKAFEKLQKNKSAAKSIFKHLPSVPVDVALMEKTQSGVLVAGDFGWNDVGSWTALPEVLPSNAQAGLIQTHGDFFTIDSTGIVADIESPKFLALLGVHNLIVVETKGAILIASKDKAQEIKSIVQHLQKSKKNSRLV